MLHSGWNSDFTKYCLGVLIAPQSPVAQQSALRTLDEEVPISIPGMTNLKNELDILGSALEQIPLP